MVLFHAVIWLTVYISCLVTKADIAFFLHTDMICKLFQTIPTGTVGEETRISVSVLLLPIIVSFSLCLCQMTVSLFIRPTLSFLAMAVIIISSVYFLSPALLCNYAMLIRTELFVSNGVNIEIGYVYSFLFIILLMVFGLNFFKSYDVLNRD